MFQLCGVSPLHVAKNKTSSKNFNQLFPTYSAGLLHS